MKTKSIVAVMCFFAFSIMSISAIAQTEKRPMVKNQKLKERKAEVETQKIEFIKKYLELNATEAEQFQKIYQESAGKEKELRVAFRKEMKPLLDKKWQDLSEKEAEELLSKQESHILAINNLHKETILKYKKVMPVAKVAKIKQAENEFKKELLKNAREKRKMNMNTEEITE